ncbi:MAG: aminodeoxychorismate/anthranilate synthase component II [Patescibacteria group bacterium]
MKILIIDNYDSFTYNLYQYVGMLGGNPVVERNDAVTLDDVRGGGYTHVVISPGPGDPTDPQYFGVCKDVILECGKTTPVLGVCLGHQGIIAAFGGRVVRAPVVKHGKVSLIVHEGKGIFKSLASPLQGMRYHSLAGERESLPACLEITALAKDDGQIMGVRHRQFPIEGIQFHPESIRTELGMDLIKNFLGL